MKTESARVRKIDWSEVPTGDDGPPVDPKRIYAPIRRPRIERTGQNNITTSLENWSE